MTWPQLEEKRTGGDWGLILFSCMPVAVWNSRSASVWQISSNASSTERKKERKEICKETPADLRVLFGLSKCTLCIPRGANKGSSSQGFHTCSHYWRWSLRLNRFMFLRPADSPLAPCHGRRCRVCSGKLWRISKLGSGCSWPSSMHSAQNTSLITAPE